jgi:hypothetical protein
MKRPSLGFFALWLLIAVSGSAWLASQGGSSLPTAEWKATRDLSKNHQLTEADIEGPTEKHLLARMPKKESLIGQHLWRNRKEGDSIGRADLASQPSLEPCEPGSGVWLYALKGNEYLAEGVQAGSWVVVCSVRKEKEKVPKTYCSNHSLAVEAVHRPTKAGDSTWVALRVPKCRLADLGEYVVSGESRFLLVAASRPPREHQACQGGLTPASSSR